ncbi:MAG: hypothetical protein U9N41_08000 [Euryarchaeota archaeon]|nr:hypothetical protein [Euryarchaeota archaeon]
MKVDRLNLHRIRWKLLIVFIIAVLIAEILVVRVSEDDLIRCISGILSYYPLLTKGFGAGVFLLCLLHYFVVIRKTEEFPEKLTFQFLGPLDLLIKDLPLIVSTFYIPLVIFYHIFKGTFSNELSVDQLIILGFVMAYLAYWCFMQVYIRIRDIFYNVPAVKVKSKSDK